MLVTARLAKVKLEFTSAIAVLALDCAFVKAKFALVTARLAIVKLENAEEVALLALRTTIWMVEVAEF